MALVWTVILVLVLIGVIAFSTLETKIRKLEKKINSDEKKNV